MRGAGRARARRTAAWLLLAMAASVCAACTTTAYEVPVPTFPGPPRIAGAATAGDAALADCEQVLPVADLVALLGLPLESVTVRTIVGVPEPSVGRVERIACRYTGSSGRARGMPLLELNAARYVDAASASRQWRINAAAEDGPRRTLALGTAPGMLVERAGEALFTVVDRDVALTITLPARAPRAPQRTAADTLADLALRVLAAVSPAEVATGQRAAAG
ncbi:MAG: hypothetical protein ACT4RN_04440 [Pseudonocardia sp.]